MDQQIYQLCGRILVQDLGLEQMMVIRLFCMTSLQTDGSLVNFLFRLSNGPFYELIAVSSTSDPLGTYNRYIYSFTNLP